MQNSHEERHARSIGEQPGTGLGSDWPAVSVGRVQRRSLAMLALGNHSHAGAFGAAGGRSRFLQCTLLLTST